jgi:tetratricopeptide (TPR) repeat protein
MVLRFPESFAAHYFNGKALAAQGRHDPAEAAFRRALALAPGLEEARLELIKIYQAQNRSDMLIREHRELLAHNPDNNPATVDLAVHYREAGQPELGRQLLLQLGQRSESDGTILAHLFQRYYETEQYETVVWALDGMLAGAPQSSELHYLAGLAHDGLKHTQEALDHLGKVQAGSRFFSNAAVHRALLLHDAGEVEQAIQVIKQALAHDPAHAQYYLYIGAFYEKLGHYEQALAALQQGSAVDDRNARIHFRMGVIYDKMERPHDVIAAMQKSLRLQPEDAETLNYLGYTYAELGINLNEAEELIQKALRIKPDDGYITDSLAWVYYKMGRYEEALEWMIKAVTLVPDDPTILEHTGDVYLKLDNAAKALKYYQRSLELRDPGHDSLEEKIRALQQQL